MPFTTKEKCGISDLLEVGEENVPILIQIARSVTKNVVDIATTQEALEYIFTHVDSCVSLLNKRAITKEVLFKYLHAKNVAVTGDFTKALLIKKVLSYWNLSTEETSKHDQQYLQTPSAQEDPKEIVRNEVTTESPSPPEISSIQNCVAFNSKTSDHHTSISTTNESEFPINLLARKFSEWFFNNYNSSALNPQDFWTDAQLLLRIAANDGIREHNCDDAHSLLETLFNTKQQFGFLFNPNLTHAGVQGRMDVHGLVVVLACGTLHTETQCVGLFECAFGLLRDPFSENNWKTKTMQLMLRSKGTPATPSLQESDTLKEALTLPVPQGELS